MARALPFARFRRAARLGALGLLIGILALGMLFRTDIVRQFPALAEVYASLGIEVNVVGLKFRDVKTLLGLSEGRNVMRITAKIYSIAAANVIVPGVLVTLLDDGGNPIYQWSVTPAVRDLDPNEVTDFSTQVTSPPEGATRVRLTFTDSRPQSKGPTAPITGSRP